ncbi:hypothetical protein VNI00_006483 [Paramarasmius palmivorus]|uniref:Uncharacterized protein n=1 Tax=Paramarasmius palmivorus TaxID=297713 RepID=A0AAW0D9L5_9AGAR
MSMNSVERHSIANSPVAPAPPSRSFALVPSDIPGGVPRSEVQTPPLSLARRMYFAMLQVEALYRSSHPYVRENAPPTLPRLVRSQAEAHSGTMMPFSQRQNGARVSGENNGQQHVPNTASAIRLQRFYPVGHSHSGIAYLDLKNPFIKTAQNSIQPKKSLITSLPVTLGKTLEEGGTVASLDAPTTQGSGSVVGIG